MHASVYLCILKHDIDVIAFTEDVSVTRSFLDWWPDAVGFAGDFFVLLFRFSLSKCQLIFVLFLNCGHVICDVDT